MSYISRQKKTSSFDPRLAIAGGILVITVLMLFFGIRFLFRGTKEEPSEKTPATKTETGLLDSPAIKQMQTDVYARDAQIEGVSGYSVRGAAQLRITFSDYQMTMAASLPPIDSQREQYEAWMLQPGIADYFSVGTFYPRADGWYGLTYKNNRAHVPAEPQTYNRILITREPLEDDRIPSNIRVAEGFFGL